MNDFNRDFTHDSTQDPAYIPFVEPDEETRNREQLGYAERRRTMEEQIVEVEQQDLLDPLDPLARFREQVRGELAEKSVRQKMSPEALAKFRAQRDADRTANAGQERFINGLKSVTVTTDNLKRLISLCGIPVPTMLDRRATKLNWFVRAGYELGREISTPTLVLFFSELTPDETSMSDDRFAREWSDESAVKTRACRIRRGIISETVETEPREAKADEPRICGLKSKCLRAVKRRGAVVVGKGLYCSEICKGAARAAKMRVKAVVNKPFSPEVAILAQ